MNTSLRRIAVTIMALIVLLLANATLTQVFTRRRAARRSAQPAGAARRVLAPARPDLRRRPAAGLFGVHQRPVPVPARLPQSACRTRRSPGFYSLRYSSTGLERAEDAMLNGSDQRLFGRRLADFFTGRDPRGGNVDDHHQPAGPAGRLGRDAAGLQRSVQGRGGGAGAVDRQGPGDGVLAVVRPQPAGHPRHRGSSRTAWQQLRDDPDSPLLNRAISETLSARARRSR